MVFCKVCNDEVEAEEDFAAGCSYCTKCGSVLEEENFVNAVSFSAEGGMVGQMVTEGTAAFQTAVTTDGSGLYKNHTRGRIELSLLVDQLNIHPRDDTIEAAHRLYKLAVHRGFLRGRRTSMVSAACIYIICRQDRKPYLLIDFSDSLQVNLYALGIVYLDLCLLFKMEHHPVITSMVDPSLFIHRYADRLRFKEKTQMVVKTALALIKSMKRDWILTGRRPSGLCGAALLLASQIHGCPKPKKDIVHIVHVCGTTVTKRLEEFSQTTCGQLTPKEFEVKAVEFEQDELALLNKLPENDPAEQAVDGKIEDRAPIDNRCHHIEKAGAKYHLHGMCLKCYTEYIKVSGGIIPGTSNPPVIIRQEKENKKALAKRRRAFLKESMRNDSDIDEDALDVHPIDEVEDEMERALSTREMSSICASFSNLNSKPQAENSKLLCSAEQLAAPGGLKTVKRPRRSARMKDLALVAMQSDGSDSEPPLAATVNDIADDDPDFTVLSELDYLSEDVSGSDEDALLSKPPALDRNGNGNGKAVFLDEDQVTSGVENPNCHGNDKDEDHLLPRSKSQSGQEIVPKNTASGLIENRDINGNDATLSDIDDDEIEEYIRTEFEAEQKELWWNEMYMDYMIKARAKRQQEELEKQEEPRKKRKWVRKKGLRNKNSDDVTPLEAAKGALEEQGLTKKINYDQLEKLFDTGGNGGDNKETAEVSGSCRRAREQEEAEEQRQALQAERTRQRSSEFLRALTFREDDQVSKKGPKRLHGLYT